MPLNILLMSGTGDHAPYGSRIHALFPARPRPVQPVELHG